MAYKGKFTGMKNPHKYAGDPNNVVYRSHWERNVMRWLDENPNVIEWGSEELAIPYENPVRGFARYYPDFLFKMKDGLVRIVEVKPLKQTREPEKPSRRTKKYLEEKVTYATNIEKWKAAEAFCRKHGICFEIWTEENLKSMGILQWQTDKRVLRKEGAANKKPRLERKPRTRRPRPKRKS